MYFAEEGLNVDSIRHLTWQKNYAIKQNRKRQLNDFRDITEQFADGRIEATWHERGPNNEAGDVKVIDYVPSLDRFYVISSVGHLWRGTTAGDDWILLNDDIQFAKDFIKVLPHGEARVFLPLMVRAPKIRRSDILMMKDRPGPRVPALIL